MSEQAGDAAPTLDAGRAELVQRIAQIARAPGSVEPLPGLTLSRAISPSELLHRVYDPVFCIIAQGSKNVFVGDERYRYDPTHYLLVTAELPVVAQVVDATADRPYFSLRLTLDPALVSSILIEAGQDPAHDQADIRAITVNVLDAGMLDAVVRLVRLAKSPAEARFLAPLIQREIVYRLLLGGQGERLRYIAAQSGNTHRIVRAIGRLRVEFDQPLRMENVARDLGMSVSSFHHHFKSVTGMSPLQFQKRVRLQEARRLMLGERLDAASTASRVGYDDASHFSREYKRLFGLPPMRDIQRLQAGSGQEMTLAEGV